MNTYKVFIVVVFFYLSTPSQQHNIVSSMLCDFFTHACGHYKSKETWQDWMVNWRFPFQNRIFFLDPVSVLPLTTRSFNKRNSFLSILFVNLTKDKLSSHLPARRNATTLADILNQQMILGYFHYVDGILIVYNKTSADKDDLPQPFSDIHPVLFKTIYWQLWNPKLPFPQPQQCHVNSPWTNNSAPPSL